MSRELMQVACCPSCDEALIVTCPNACPNAELGASPGLDPIGSLPRPSGPKRPATHRPGTFSATTLRILGAIVAAPLPVSASEIADALGLKQPRVTMALSGLAASNYVRREKGARPAGVHDGRALVFRYSVGTIPDGVLDGPATPEEIGGGAPWTCGRCQAPIAKKLGRAPKYCEPCLTPAEMKALEVRRAYNARYRARTP